MANTSVGRATGNTAAVGSDRPGNFVKAVESASSEVRVQQGQGATSIGQGAKAPVTISQIIQEAVRRSGIVITDGRFSKGDVAAINSEIRKDPALAAALVQARGDYKRGKGKLDDSEVAADSKESERRAEEGADAAEGGSSESTLSAGAVRTTEAYSSEPQAFDISSTSVPVRDIASEMLKKFDLDGDGVITVRQVLEYFILYARDEINFNEVELANIMKVLTEGINEAAANLHLGEDGKFVIRHDLAA